MWAYNDFGNWLVCAGRKEIARVWSERAHGDAELMARSKEMLSMLREAARLIDASTPEGADFIERASRLDRQFEE